MIAKQPKQESFLICCPLRSMLLHWFNFLNSKDKTGTKYKHNSWWMCLTGKKIEMQFDLDTE